MRASFARAATKREEVGMGHPYVVFAGRHFAGETMHSPSPSLRLALLLAGAMIAGGTSAGATTRPSARMPAMNTAVDPPGELLERVLQQPALVAVAHQVQGLEYWPIVPHGSSKPRTITKKLNLGYSSLVAKGELIYAATGNPPEVLVYDIKTRTQGTMADPFGAPIDIAIGKDSSLYVINDVKANGNVAWYPKGSGPAQELTCKYIDVGEAIAVDNEGDIFVAGYEKGNSAGVIEIPNGPSGPQSGTCKRLRLIPGDTPAGLAIEPKSDSLLTLENPDQCAGGDEGQMTIYPKPYLPTTAVVVQLGGNCTGGLRLNADSTMVFYGDESVSGGFTYIDASTYPRGKHLGVYSEGGSFGGQGPSGFTTVPNTLPN
jgi:hypothetical protein